MSDAAKVVLYGNETCPYCGAARMLLKKKGIDYEDISLSGNPDLKSEVAKRAGRTSVPQIFVGDTHVGGFDDLYELDKTGGLDKLLAEQQA